MTLAVHVSGSGEPLVMLHGWGMNSLVWGRVTERLNENYEVMRIDLPGHGDSPAHAATSELDDWVDAVLEVAPDRAVWVGWSLGGMIAQRAALRSAARVKALMLVTSSPCFMQRDEWQAGMAEQTLEQFSQQLLQDTNKTLLRFLGLQVRGAVEERKLLKQLREAIAVSGLPSQQALTCGLHLLRHVDLRDRISALEMPSCWLFGERDALVSAQTSDFIRMALPQAKRIVIPGSGHAPFLSHPEISATALEMLMRQAGEETAA